MANHLFDHAFWAAETSTTNIILSTIRVIWATWILNRYLNARQDIALEFGYCNIGISVDFAWF